GPRAAEALARCDVTRVVVGAALEVGIVQIDDVRQPPATYEPLEGGAGFLRRIPVGLVFEGTTAQLAALLAQFEPYEDKTSGKRVHDGRFLELGACRVTRAKDSRPEEGRLQIEAELGAPTIEREAPPDAQSSSQPE